MRFTFLAATIAAVIAREDQSLAAQAAPETPDQKEYQKASYYRRVKDPFVRARYKNAMDRCRGHSNAKKRYNCFKRNWNLFKPHRQNKLNDLRARTHRACWKYKNNILKRAKCFAKHVKDYKGELAKGLLADGEQEKKLHQQEETNDKEEIESKFQAAAEQQEGSDGGEDDDLVQMDHVNERELSSASSTDSEESSTSSDDTSDDNNHKAGTPTNQKLASGERRAGRRDRLNNIKKAQAAQ